MYKRQVQELRKNKRRPTATGKTSLFSGLVFCADCGSKLHFCAAKSLKANQEFFRCANYKSGRGECTIHYIRNVALEQKEKELAELERESVDIRLLLAGLREYSSMLNLDKRENEIVDGERGEEEPQKSSADRER